VFNFYGSSDSGSKNPVFGWAEGRGSDVGIAFRGGLCVPNVSFERSKAGDTAARTPTKGRISQQNTESVSSSTRHCGVCTCAILSVRL
jgi:hypothetical protein